MQLQGEPFGAPIVFVVYELDVWLQVTSTYRYQQVPVESVYFCQDARLRHPSARDRRDGRQSTLCHCQSNYQNASGVIR